MMVCAQAKNLTTDLAVVIGDSKKKSGEKTKESLARYKSKLTKENRGLTSNYLRVDIEGCRKRVAPSDAGKNAG